MIDLSKFKKVKEEKGKFVLRHEDGHELHMDRAKLAPELDKGLSELKMADGGEVPPDSTQIPNLAAADAPPIAPDELTQPPGVLDFTQAGPTPPAPVIPPSPESQDPYGLGAETQAMKQGYDQQIAGINAEANAKGAQGTEQAGVLDKQAANMQQMAATYRKNFNDLNNERKGFIADIQNQHIDPNHYVGSMDDGKRIRTGIGLMLSGLGAGMAGQSNMAQDFLQKSIDRDIDAQKANLGKSENLLSANMRQFGNLHDATAMTRSMMNDMYSSQIQAAAARSASPQAQALAQQHIGALQMQNAQIFQQLAMRKTMMEHASDNPGMAIQTLVPQAQQKQAYEELQRTQNLGTQRDTLLNLFDKANQDNTVAKTGAGLFRTPASVQGLQVAIMPYLKDAEGRINEQELQRVDGLIPRPGDSSDKVMQKRRALLSFLGEKSSAPILETYGIRPKGGASKFNAQGQRTIQLGPVK